MKKNSLLILAIIVVSVLNLRAQGSVLPFASSQLVDGIGAVNSQANSTLFAKKYNTIYDNTPYLPAQNMVAGYFVQANGKRFEIEKMAYNAYEKRVEYAVKNDLFYPKEQIIEFGFESGEVFQRNFKPMDDHDEATYFQVLYNAKTRLLLHTRAALLEVAAYSSADKIKHFDSTDTYYVLKSDGTFSKSRRLDSTLLEVLGDKKPLIDAFIDTNKLKCKSASDLKKVLAYYDSL